MQPCAGSYTPETMVRKEETHTPSTELSSFRGVLCWAVLSHSVVSDSLRPHGLQPTRLYPWRFSRQEYWSGLPCPPPGDLPPGLPYFRWIIYHLSHWGRPKVTPAADIKKTKTETYSLSKFCLFLLCC